MDHKKPFSLSALATLSAAAWLVAYVAMWLLPTAYSTPGQEVLAVTWTIVGYLQLFGIFFFAITIIRFFSHHSIEKKPLVWVKPFVFSFFGVFCWLIFALRLDALRYEVLDNRWQYFLDTLGNDVRMALLGAIGFVVIFFPISWLLIRPKQIPPTPPDTKA